MVAVSTRAVLATRLTVRGGASGILRRPSSTGQPMNPSRRQHLLVAALVFSAAAATALFWPGHDGITDQPPALSAEQIAVAPDGILVQTAATEIRWWLAGDASRQPRWRELDAPARNVLALSWVEGGAAGTRLDPFRGFNALSAAQSPLRPTAEDLAAAYDAIGASEVATVCRELERNAEANASGEIDAKFRAARSRADTAGKIRSYIRQHAAALSAVRQH